MLIQILSRNSEIIGNQYRNKVMPSEQNSATIQLPKITQNKINEMCQIPVDVFDRPVLKPIPRSILERYANKPAPEKPVHHPTSERVYLESMGKHHAYKVREDRRRSKKIPRRKIPSINFSDIEEQIRNVNVEDSPKAIKRNLKVNYDHHRKPRSHRDEHYRRKARPRSCSRKSRKKKAKKKSRSPTR